MKKAPIVRMEPTIPFTTGPQYMRLKNSYRPQTAPEQRLTDSSGVPIETGTDPRFSSQVGFHLFGFSDIQKTFPIKDKEKATEYESADDYLDAMTVHDRKEYHPYQIYQRPVTASQVVKFMFKISL